MNSQKLFAPIAKVTAFMLAACLFITGTNLHAVSDPEVQDGSRFDQELNERDFEALRRYLNSKRETNLEDKEATTVTISGDVRFEYRHLNEDLKSIRLRGDNRRHPERNLPVSRNDFDAEFNLKFDYLMDRSWAVAHLQYDNSAGVDSQDRGCKEDPHGWFGSGKCDSLCLRKAFMGYNFYMDDCLGRFDVELGRRGNMYNVFDSRVQFLSRFDGILLKWTGKYDFAKEVYAKLGGFVVDERVNHFAYVTEVGALNILDSGIDLKYSFINWCEQVGSRCIKELCSEETDSSYFYKTLNKPKAFDFAVSQWTIYYNLDPSILGRKAKVFAAILMNHNWKKFEVEKTTYTRVSETKVIDTTTSKKYRANLGWYAGIAIGEVRKENDWALELQYQYVEALAVPGQDAAGICNGNVFDYTLTQTNRRYIDNTNYKGWKLEGLYALTDNITIDSIIERTTSANEHIGGSHVYSKVELEAIYAF